MTEPSWLDAFVSVFKVGVLLICGAYFAGHLIGFAISGALQVMTLMGVR